MNEVKLESPNGSIHANQAWLAEQMRVTQTFLWYALNKNPITTVDIETVYIEIDDDGGG